MRKNKLVALVISAIIGISQNTLAVLAEEAKEKNLEKNVIHVSGLGNQIKVIKEGGKHKFNIGFDEDKKEIKVFDKNNISMHDYFRGKKYFEIKIFNKEGLEKLHIDLLGEDSGESEKLNKLNGFKYEYGDVIKLWFAEPNRESIDGNIIDAQEDYSDKIQNRDYIDNVVFQITENGLRSIYNNAPKITGVENLKIRLNSSFNKLQDIIATDDYDGDITEKLVVNGEVNTSIAGNYPIEYISIDKWGRESKLTRIITVSEPNKLENNIIHIDSLEEENIKDIFKIGFDDFEKKIKVYEEKDNFINSSKSKEKVFYIKIMNKNREEKLLVNLNGINKGNSEKLNVLKEFIYEYGDIVKLWSIDGSKQRIEGEIIEGKENYLDGIQGVEGFNKIENVEFEITEQGLKAKYNSSPQIIGADDVNIKIGNVFEKIAGVTAIDLEDKDISKKIAVAGTVNVDKEGENILEYSVIDNTGNKSIVKRKVIVSQKKALEQNIICTEGIGRIKHRDKFKIGFDEDKKEIKVYDQSWSHLHNYYMRKNYFKISILDKNLNEKLNITLDGAARGTTAKLDALKGFKYEYGDIIKLWHAEPMKQTIFGNIINAKEDYSQGVKMVSGFKSIDDIAFEITENGLNAIYKTPPQISGAEDIEIKVGDNFDVNTGVTATDDRDGDITNKLVITGVVDANNSGLYTVDYSVVDSWGKKSVIKRRVSVRENKKPIILGVDNLVIRIGEDFDPLKGVTAQDEEDLDLTSKIQISGDVNTDITSRYNLVYSVTDSAGNTTIATRTIRVIPSKRPTIIGADNTTIKVGEYFNPLKGVSIKDWQGRDITNKLKITGEVIEKIGGKYNLVYSVEDEEGNTIIATRTVIVRSNDKPYIIGADNIIISVGDNFNPRIGIAAMDREDLDLTSQMEISGVVNPIVPGIYNIIYSVTDKDNNKTSVSRNITVRSKSKPVMLGVDDVSIKEGDDFNPLLGVMAHDEEEGDLTNSISVVGKVNSKIAANYNLVYSVTDGDGNQYTVTRRVTVRTNYKPIIKGAEDITIELNQSFDPILGIMAYDKEDEDLTKNITMSGNVNNKVSGKYNLLYTVKDKDGNISAITRKVNVGGNDSPTITGASDLSININDPFNPITGVIASDIQDGDLTSAIKISGHVDNKVNGKYNLVYSVTDKEGNKSIVTRKVIVRTPSKPMIRGIDDITISVNDKFEPMEGIIATDEEDGDLTQNIIISGNVNNKISGNYNLVYSVIDSDGNKSTITRKVIVRGNNKPIIKGAEDITIKEGEEFNPMTSVIAKDSEDGDLTKSITVTGNVNNKIHGEYNLVYSVSDKDGNKSIITRRVNVRSNEKPIIRGVENISIKIGESFDLMKGIVASDLEDGDLTSNIKTVGVINNNISGLYNIVYSVEDKDGNNSIVNRVITVRVNEKPVIRGIEDVTINEGEKFDAREGIIAFDSEDGDLTEEIKIEAHIDNEVNGRYNLVYSVIDKNGNKSIANRIITVRAIEKPIIRGAENITIKTATTFSPTLGVVAVDKDNNNLTNDLKIVGNINNKVPGEYKIIYSVTDKYGNKNTVTRIVKVKGNDNPVIVGNDDIQVKLGEKFDEKLGVIAFDDNNEDLTENIEIQGKVDNEKIGIYTVVYSVKDKNNNITKEERKITVVNEDFPIIEGAEKVLIKNSEEFNPMEGIIGKDKKDGEITSLIKIDGNINNKVNGRYKLTYSIENKDGNKTIVPREVIVGEDRNLIDESNIPNEEGKITNDVLLKNKKNNEIPIKALVALGAAISVAVISIFKIKKK